MEPRVVEPQVRPAEAPVTRPTQPQASSKAAPVVIRSSGPESARNLANSAVRESSRVTAAARSNHGMMPSVPATARALLRRSSKDLRLGRPGKEMTEVPEVLKNLRKSWCAFRIQRRWRIYCAKKFKQVLMTMGESPEIQFVGTREWLQKSGKPLGMSVSAPADQQQWEKSKKGAKRELDHRFLYDFRVAKEKKQPIQVRASANVPQPVRTMPGMQPGMPPGMGMQPYSRMPGFPAGGGMGVGMQRMSIRR